MKITKSSFQSKLLEVNTGQSYGATKEAYKKHRLKNVLVNKLSSPEISFTSERTFRVPNYRENKPIKMHVLLRLRCPVF